MTPVSVKIIGELIPVEIVTRELRQAFHVESEIDRPHAERPEEIIRVLVILIELEPPAMDIENHMPGSIGATRFESSLKS